MKHTAPIWHHRTPAGLCTVAVREFALRYTDTDAEHPADRPPHVRAGSGLCWWGGELAVVQDDCHFLALVNPQTRSVRSVALPADADGRRQFQSADGSKSRKVDLEAVVVWPDGQLVALGSGSTAARERWLVARCQPDGRVDARWLDASPLYQLLRDEPAFSGAELNLEGAAVADNALWLLQRGNGAATETRQPVDALASIPLHALDLSGPALRWTGGHKPRLHMHAVLDLGATPVRKTGTDLVWRRDPAPASLWMTVAAEASPDTYHDGEVVWSGLARLAKGDHGPVWELVPLVDLHGGLTRDKLEGLAADPTDPGRFWAVVDADDTAVPCKLLELRVMGPNWSPALPRR